MSFVDARIYFLRSIEQCVLLPQLAVIWTEIGCLLIPRLVALDEELATKVGVDRVELLYWRPASNVH